MRYERVKITRDERTVYNRAVLPWEVPILEFTFGDGNVQRLYDYEDNALPYPDAKEEFHRLIGAYGSDTESGIAHVATIYGQSAAGVRALGKAIAEAEKESRQAKPKQTRASRRKEFATDPLMV